MGMFLTMPDTMVMFILHEKDVINSLDILAGGRCLDKYPDGCVKIIKKLSIIKKSINYQKNYYYKKLSRNYQLSKNYQKNYQLSKNN